MKPPRGLLVTGTDTGIGKTMISAAICASLRARGALVRAFKPVESGTADNEGVPADAQLLAACSGMSGWRDANFISLKEPLAPVVAASRGSTELDFEGMTARMETLRAQGPLVVEGVGGVLVEVVPGITVADLAVRWNLNVLVVAGNRLGVLNHTLLTLEALQSRGAAIAGVVLNTLSPDEPTVAERTNSAELTRLLPPTVRLLGRFRFIPPDKQRDREALAAAGGWLTGRLLPLFG